jgi:hypothetical protein
VVAGSFIGTICSVISYLTFWSNPFTFTSFTSDNTGCAKVVYGNGNETNRRSRNIDFELEGLEEIDNV